MGLPGGAACSRQLCPCGQQAEDRRVVGGGGMPPSVSAGLCAWLWMKDNTSRALRARGERTTETGSPAKTSPCLSGDAADPVPRVPGLLGSGKYMTLLPMLSRECGCQDFSVADLPNRGEMETRMPLARAKLA